MRITIASRIFAPEAAAAAFRLEALANEAHRMGHVVTVLTVKPPRLLAEPSRDAREPYKVRRFPVLRDRAGYVRGYLQYLSFDVPLFFRLLLGPRADVIVAEPPPTTGLVVRVAAALRRSKYVYYSADIWSDAALATGAPRFVIAAVRKMEQFALRGAAGVLSVNEEMTRRVRELAPVAKIFTAGNGVDDQIFTPGERTHEGKPYAIYSGTASEWQGAEIFIQAFAEMADEVPDAQLVFLGQGSDWAHLKSKASVIQPGRVLFRDSVPPEQAAVFLRNASLSLASLRPRSGYESAFPTKIFASWACGTPVVFAGEGQVSDFFHQQIGVNAVGEACDYSVESVKAALLSAFQHPLTHSEREALSYWASESFSLQAVAARAVSHIVEEVIA